MSEYQSHEFQALDRALTATEQAKLRTYSSRATITSQRFSVDYSWGAFKGDATEWMEKYFDAYLHMANWGTRLFMLRLPRAVLPLELAQPFCVADSASVHAKGDHVILSFLSEDEDPEWLEEEDDTLASLLPLRAELAGGDFRALYLGWLACVQAEEIEEEALEPPCPPGLAELTPALDAFAEFLRIDPDLLTAASTASQPITPADQTALEAWLRGLGDADKTDALLRVVRGGAPHLHGELLRRFQASCSTRMPNRQREARTAGALREAAQALGDRRRLREAERAEKERLRREREEAAARDQHLRALASREAEAWKQVDALIATKMPKRYDEAVTLLRDLRDVCVRAGRTEEADRRLALLHDQHAKKPSFLQRLQSASLL